MNPPPEILEILEKHFLSVLQILQIFGRFIANFPQISKIALETLQIRSFPFGVYKYYIPPNGRFRNLQYSGAEFAVDVFQNLRAKCAQFAKFEKFAVRKSPKVHVEKTLIV